MGRANHWAPAEIIGALQAWAAEHGRSLRQVEWKLASSSHPSSLTVRRLFPDWNEALRRAGLARVAPPVRHPWSDLDAAGLDPPARPPVRNTPWPSERIIQALRESNDEHGYPPAGLQFLNGDPVFFVTTALYDYASGNPVNAVDPSVLASVPCETTTERIERLERLERSSDCLKGTPGKTQKNAADGSSKSTWK